jgi:hypothetical protein
VIADLDALLTALHVLIDDHVIPSGRRALRQRAARQHSATFVMKLRAASSHNA